MVAKENLVHFFIGQDIVGPDGSSRKDEALQRIKKEFLPSATRDFNSDTLYGRGTNLKELQEKLLFFPVGSRKRLLVIKDLQFFKEDLRAYLLRYVAKPHPSTVLVLDFIPREPDNKEEMRFAAALSRYARVQRFGQARAVNAFELSRRIEARRPLEALRVLKELFDNGERPEKILGSLRSSWQRNITDSLELRKRLKLLIACDTDIKTGRLEPPLALERLVVYLCSLNPAQRSWA